MEYYKAAISILLGELRFLNERMGRKLATTEELLVAAAAKAAQEREDMLAGAEVLISNNSALRAQNEALKTQVEELQAELDAGDHVTPEQLQTLMDTIDGIYNPGDIGEPEVTPTG